MSYPIHTQTLGLSDLYNSGLNHNYNDKARNKTIRNRNMKNYILEITTKRIKDRFTFVL